MSPSEMLPQAGEVPKVTGFIRVKNKNLLEDYSNFYVTLNEEEHPYDPRHKLTLYYGVDHDYKDIIYVFETKFYIFAEDILDFVIFTEYNARRFELMSTLSADEPKYYYVNDFAIKEHYAKMMSAETEISDEVDNGFGDTDESESDYSHDPTHVADGVTVNMVRQACFNALDSLSAEMEKHHVRIERMPTLDDRKLLLRTLQDNQWRIAFDDEDLSFESESGCSVSAFFARHGDTNHMEIAVKLNPSVEGDSHNVQRAIQHTVEEIIQTYVLPRAKLTTLNSDFEPLNICGND